MLFDIDLEKFVLGSVLIDKNLVDNHSDDLREDLFHEQDNIIVCRAINSLIKEGVAVDMLTVYNKIKGMGVKMQHSYVPNLTQGIGSTAHFESHLLKLKELYMRRKLHFLAHTIQASSQDGNIDIFELIDTTEAELISITDTDTHSEAKRMEDVLVEVVREVETLSNQDIPFLGFRTGFTDYDAITCGLKGGTFNIVAARPAMGKTSFMMNVILNGVQHEKYPALVISLEMQNTELAYRIVSSETEINSNSLKLGRVTNTDFETINNKVGLLMDKNVYMYDNSTCTLQTIKKQARKIINRHGGISLIAIDYIQLMNSLGKHGTREQEVASISKGLKAIAKDLDVPVIALAQLSRAVETRSDKRPILSDLKESGSLEQDADTVTFLHRPEYYGITELDNGDSSEGVALAIVAKNRHGRTGEVQMRFIKQFTKFVDMRSNFNSSYTPDRDFEPLKPNEEF